MAFVRRTVRDGRPPTGSSGFSIGGIVRWIALPCIGLVLAAWSVAIVAGLHSAASLASAESFVKRPLHHTNGAPSDRLKGARLTRIAQALEAEKSARLVIPAVAPAKVLSLPAELEDPFAKIVTQARLSTDLLLAAFARAGMTIPQNPKSAVAASLSPPAEERFYRMAGESGPIADRFGAAETPRQSALAPTAEHDPRFAYAMAEPQPAEAVWGSLARLTETPTNEGHETAATAKGMQDAVPPPSRIKRGAAPSAKPEALASLRPNKPAEISSRSKPSKRGTKPEAEALAYARPDKPKSPGVFGNLFNRPKAGNGVAIYDISASVVHMPDGTKLEAHSGIGNMADNPRFVHVKMKGPTPPNTYNLTMREKRFHGVEAIRMTPVGGQTMHGRDGMLAHSYLLRGGREESHGCVAFANYPRFLKAFKQGKIKQLIVVGSLSRAPVRLASTSRKT